MGRAGKDVGRGHGRARRPLRLRMSRLADCRRTLHRRLLPNDARDHNRYSRGAVMKIADLVQPRACEFSVVLLFARALSGTSLQAITWSDVGTSSQN